MLWPDPHSLGDRDGGWHMVPSSLQLLGAFSSVPSFRSKGRSRLGQRSSALQQRRASPSWQISSKTFWIPKFNPRKSFGIIPHLHATLPVEPMNPLLGKHPIASFQGDLSLLPRGHVVRISFFSLLAGRVSRPAYRQLYIQTERPGAIHSQEQQNGFGVRHG